MKIAFTTQDMKRVDAHFGSAPKLAIYEVSPEESKFLEAIQFDVLTEESGSHDEAEDRLSAKIDALKGCSLLFTLAIGGPAAARVVNNKVHPIKINQPEGIPEVIDRVQTMLKGNPPPWLRKVLANGEKSMDFLDGED